MTTAAAKNKYSKTISATKHQLKHYSKNPKIPFLRTRRALPASEALSILKNWFPKDDEEEADQDKNDDNDNDDDNDNVNDDDEKCGMWR